MVTLEVTQHGSHSHAVRNQEGKRIVEFCVAMNMRVGNTLFMKRVSHLVTYESDPSKTQVDYCLETRKQRKFLKDTKVLPNEECITQHKPLACDFNISE